MRKAEASRRAETAIADFDLGEFADRPCRTYSGGQRRRLEIAMGVIHRPDVVLLDEPSAGLDPVSRAGLWDQIRALRDSGITVIITTHYLDEADALCDRLSIVDHGTIVAEGTPEELKAQVLGDVVTVRFAAGDDGDERPVGVRAAEAVRVVGAPRVETLDGNRLRIFVAQGAPSLAPIIRAFDDAGLSIAHLDLHQPSLDDVFLDKTGRSMRAPAADYNLTETS